MTESDAEADIDGLAGGSSDEEGRSGSSSSPELECYGCEITSKSPCPIAAKLQKRKRSSSDQAKEESDRVVKRKRSSSDQAKQESDRVRQKRASSDQAKEECDMGLKVMWARTTRRAVKGSSKKKKLIKSGCWCGNCANVLRSRFKLELQQVGGSLKKLKLVIVKGKFPEFRPRLRVAVKNYIRLRSGGKSKICGADIAVKVVGKDENYADLFEDEKFITIKRFIAKYTCDPGSRQVSMLFSSITYMARCVRCG